MAPRFTPAPEDDQRRGASVVPVERGGGRRVGTVDPERPKAVSERFLTACFPRRRAGSLFDGLRDVFLPTRRLDVREAVCPPPVPPRANYPTLVFVHGGWDGRIVAKLLASGMRGDSVNVGLASSSSCRMHEFAEAFIKNRRQDVGLEIPPVYFTAA